MKLKKQIYAEAALLGVALAWGTTFQLVKDALVDIDGFPFLTLRFLVALLLLIPFRGGTWRWHPAAMRAGIYLFCGYTFQTYGLLWTTPSKAAFITGLNVILVPLMVALKKRKTPGGGVCAGAFLAAAGLGLLTLEGTFLPGKGDLLVMICAVFFALQILAVEEASQHINSRQLTLIQLSMVTVFSSGMWGGFGGAINWSAPVFWALLITAVFATAAAFLAQSWSQRFTSPDRVALILATEPAFASVFSYFFGSEQYTTQKLLGCALILTGIILSELITGHNHRADPQAVSSIEETHSI